MPLRARKTPVARKAVIAITTNALPSRPHEMVSRAAIANTDPAKRKTTPDTSVSRQRDPAA